MSENKLEYPMNSSILEHSMHSGNLLNSITAHITLIIEESSPIYETACMHDDEICTFANTASNQSCHKLD